MPTSFDEYETGGTELLFADDLEGTVFTIRKDGIYEAEEVRSEIGGDVPKFGNWFPVTTNDGDAWVVALGELVDEIKAYENPIGIEIKVTRCEKTGSEQTDPYEVNTEIVTGDSRQSSL
jgi:hypothetical protein